MRFESTISIRRALWVAALSLAAFANITSAQTYNYRVVHRFSGGPSDGGDPSGAVPFDAAGNLYGVTGNGGTYNVGAIFRIAQDGSETIIHSFDEAREGTGPSDGVKIDLATGDLYGTTANGGDTSDCFGHGCGVLYK